MLMENIKVLQNQKVIKSLIIVILGSVILTFSASKIRPTLPKSTFYSKLNTTVSVTSPTF